MEIPLTEHIKQDDLRPDLTEYEKAGGYRGMHKALKEMAPSDIIDLVKSSNLQEEAEQDFRPDLNGALFQKKLMAAE